MSKFLHYAIQFILLLLLEEFVVGWLGIDIMIADTVPEIAPYLHPWGTVFVCFTIYIYFRFWLDSRMKPVKSKKNSDGWFKNTWDTANEKLIEIGNWGNKMTGSDKPLNKFVGEMTYFALMILFVFLFFAPIIIISLLFILLP